MMLGLKTMESCMRSPSKPESQRTLYVLEVVLTLAVVTKPLQLYVIQLTAPRMNYDRSFAWQVVLDYSDQNLISCPYLFLHDIRGQYSIQRENSNLYEYETNQLP